MRAVPETYPKEPRQKRCCARCKTTANFGCANQDCACHGMTLEQLLRAEAEK